MCLFRVRKKLFLFPRVGSVPDYQLLPVAGKAVNRRKSATSESAESCRKQRCIYQSSFFFVTLRTTIPMRRIEPKSHQDLSPFNLLGSDP